jgi:hypothetical protein
LWLDVSNLQGTGAESELADEVQSAFTLLGHHVRVAISDGPYLAQAFARFADTEVKPLVVSTSAREQALQALPIMALALDAEARIELARAGALTIGDLRTMSSAVFVERLLGARRSAGGRRARERSPRLSGVWPERRRTPFELLELIRGRDRSVLEVLPPSSLREELRWAHDYPVARSLEIGLETLCARLSVRLAGRSEAALELALDAAYAEGNGRVVLRSRVPLRAGDELLRAVRARARELVSSKALRGLALEVVHAAPVMPSQGTLCFAEEGPANSAALDKLLHDLSARVGHAVIGARRGGRGFVHDLPRLSHPSGNAWSCGIPTRWLVEPIAIGGMLQHGQIVVLDSRAYVIRSRHFIGRGSTRVGKREVARDYLRIWLAALEEKSDGNLESSMDRAGVSRQGMEVLVVRDPGGSYLQALYD